MRPATHKEEACHQRPGHAWKLDYDKLFDGTAWVLEPADYEPRTLAQVTNSIYTKAKRDGLVVSIRKIKPGTISVQVKS